MPEVVSQDSVPAISSTVAGLKPTELLSLPRTSKVTLMALVAIALSLFAREGGGPIAGALVTLIVTVAVSVAPSSSVTV